MKIVKSLTNCYNKFSSCGKILIFIAILLMIVVFFRNLMPVKEGMIDQNTFLFKQGNAVYDDFYADIYDYLVFSQIKNDYEVDDADLDAALALFEEGVVRLRAARERLAEAEAKVNTVVEQADGSVGLVDLDG